MIAAGTANAEYIAKALQGRRAGARWMARCPAHDDRTPSLSICDADNGKVLVRCYAGCEQEQVIAALRTRGLWSNNGPRSFPTIAARSARQPNEGDRGRGEAALRIWRSANPADGTLVNVYLASRRLHLPPPTALRSSWLKHPSGGIWPAMVALVTEGEDGTPLAIHRTFLRRDGKGKAPVEPEKMMLGPCRGGAVRLGAPGNLLMVGEGIETSLAAMQATGHPAWAALSTSGLRNLVLPNDVRDVILLADGDDPGESAARDCALRWKRQGRRVRIARPPRGMDFNDMLLGGVLHIQESAP